MSWLPGQPRTRILPGGRRRRQPSLIGSALVVTGLLVLLAWLVPGAARYLGFLLALWPLLLVALGLLVLLRRAGWIRELELNAPNVASAINWPRRLLAAFLVALGTLLLPFTLHILDERVLGAALLIGFGVLLIWRRAR
jgi:hypothetical protein